jgi:AcrR family transcriptional regulator
MDMSNDTSLSATPAEPQSLRGRERYTRIIASATELFLRDGFSETSIDRILDLSGGSKATLYSYFPTKDDLFRAVTDSVVENDRQPELDAHEDMLATLKAFAEQRLNVIFSPSHRALLRVVIAERQKFPDLARAYYEAGPKRSRELVAGYLSNLSAEGKLIIENPREAAGIFIGMLIHEWYSRSLLLDAEPPPEDAVRDRAEVVARLFIKGYGRSE